MRVVGKRWAVVVGVLVLVASACGGDDGDTTAGGDSTDGLTKIRITTLGLCNEVYQWWAQDKGIFEAHGLEVEEVKTAGGAAGVAAIVSGSADFSFTNGYTALISAAQGFPIKIVAGAYETPVPPMPVANGIIVETGSDIEEPADLAGQKIGVNELGGVNQIVTAAWLRKNDIDPADVNFVALPFPELVAAVTTGRVSAAQVPLSLLAGQEDQVRSIADPFSEGVGRVLLAGYLTTEDFLDQHAETAEQFQAALAEAVSQVEDPANQAEQFEVAAEHCNQEADVLASQPQNDYEAAVDIEVMGQMAETLVDEGQLQEELDVTDVVPEFARKD